MPNHYEILYLAPATQTEEELSPTKENVRNLIIKFGGSITLEDSLGKHKLAYPIKQARYGYYLLYEFDLEGENLKKLNREFQLLPELLRHQIVKKQPSKRIITPRTPGQFTTRVTEIKSDKKYPDSGPKPIDDKSDKDKIKLEDLDDKLDELLEGDIKMA